MKKTVLILSLVFSMALIACSDDDGDTTTDKGVINDASVVTDNGTDDSGVVENDSSVTVDQGEPANYAQTSVIDTLTLPKSINDYSRDIDGDGANDNALGALVGIASQFSYDPQPTLDSQLMSGNVLLLLGVIADSLVDDANTNVDMFEGEDPDNNPANNFSGTAELSQKSGSQIIKLAGSITAGKLDVTGDVTIVVPLGTAAAVTLKSGQILGDIDANGIANGTITGAVPMTTMDSVILPALAAQMQPIPIALPDTNGDGKISVEELKSSPLIGPLVAADVDLDGDGVKDAYSVGIAFTTTTFVLK